MATPTERNECGVITIFPMDVTCNSTNPSSYGASDGVANLEIIGGVPPYSVIWDDGSIGQSINNLSSGTYKATVTDSNDDYSVKSTCTLISPAETTTTTTTTTTTIPVYNFCLTFKQIITLNDRGDRYY